MLEEKNNLLASLQNAEARMEVYYGNWVGTFPQLKKLNTENKELRKTLKDTQQANEVLEDENETLKTENEELRKKLKDFRRANGALKDENENFKTKINVPSMRALPKATLRLPTATAVSCAHSKS